jgi:hypothetical protein
MDLDWWVKIASIIGGLTTGLAAIIIVATAIIYGLELRAIKKANELESILVVLRYIEEPNLRRARWFLYLHPEILRDIGDKPITDEWPRLNQKIQEMSKGRVDLNQIDLVLNNINNIAYLINTKRVPAYIVDDFLHHAFHRCWSAYAEYIAYRRKHPVGLSFTDKSKYAYHLETLVKRLEQRSL